MRHLDLPATDGEDDTSLVKLCLVFACRRKALKTLNRITAAPETPARNEASGGLAGLEVKDA
jgi:hypothetical protein